VRLVRDPDDLPEPYVEVEHQGIVWLVAPVYVAPVGIGQACDLAAALGCELPTPGLVDAIWRAADLRIDAARMTRSHDGTAATMDSPATHTAQTVRLAHLVDGREFVLLAGAYKDVVQHNGKVGLYGWHTADGHPIQPFYSGHWLGHRDYSQGLRLVRRK
jgi:hypothetical protein